MYARIYDKARQKYYKSLIYVGINPGYYLQYIVLNPHSKCFELVEYLDKSDRKLVPLVEIIQSDDSDMVYYKGAQLLKYKAHIPKYDCKTTVIFGYPDVCENYGFIAKLLESKAVPVSESGITLRDLPDIGEWNYIHTQEDADAFMKLFFGFHDSTLDRLCYDERQGFSRVIATFDNSGWYGIAELCFEGILAVNLRPPKENITREILDATLLVRDETIFWADDYTEQEDLSFGGSYIKALNLKWRKIES